MVKRCYDGKVTIVMQLRLGFWFDEVDEQWPVVDFGEFRRQFWRFCDGFFFAAS